jgi:O-antigen/teichoic acid export membrane protein
MAEQSNISSKLFKGTVWISAARIIVNVLAAGSTIVLARLLSPSDFGLVALGTSMLTIMTTITELSLSQALVRHDNPTDDHFHTAWSMNTLRGLLIGLLFSSLSYPASIFYNEPKLIPIMLALGLSIFISGTVNPRRIMLQRDLVFWQEFVLTVSQRLAGVIASIAVAWIYHSYWALVVGLLVTQFTNVVVSYCALPFFPKIRFGHARELLSFSIWLTLGQAVNMLNWRFDHLLVGKFLGKSALGLYTVGSTLSVMPTREMTAPLTQTIYPGFAKVSNDESRLRGAYQRAQALVTAIALPAGVGTAIIAEPLVRLTMGDQWLPAVFIIQALAAVFAFQTLGSLVEPLAMATGATRTLFIRSTQMFAVRVPLILFAMYADGLRGIVVARVFTGVLASFVNMRLVTRLIGLPLRKQVEANTRALVSVTVMGFVGLTVVYLMGPQVGTIALMSEIGILLTISPAAYLIPSWIMWRMMNRPVGPETEVYNIASATWAKIFPDAAR